MADTGLVLCGTGANISGSGTDWSNPSNITSESNYAGATLQKNGGLSNYLRATNFGFSVPTNATIDGVEVQISHMGQPTENLGDEFVYLVNSGGIISGCENKASSQDWAYQTQETYSYGGASDLWSCSLTHTIVNSSTFGVQLMVQNNSSLSNHWVRVYWIKTRVYYTQSGGGSNIKSVTGIVQASIKSIAGIAEVNIKSIAGVSN